MSRRAKIVRILAVLALLVAVVLVVVAVDVLRLPGEVGADDTRYTGAPLRQRDLWEDVSFLPEDVSARVLEVEDDLDFRRTIWLYTRTDPSRIQITTPEQEALRGRVIVELTLASRDESEPKRRSQLLNLHGALTMGRQSSDPRERDANLIAAVDSFRNAIALDPGNEDAKINLEFALRAAAPGQLSGVNPERGAARGQRAGAGRAGGGY